MASDASNPALFLPPIPGFDFLQSLVKKNTGVGLPGFGQWVAPTLNPEELERRIEELKTVQYWLEQNARMLGATIQALEVQRMTLSTLKTMNVQMTDLRDALMVRPAEAAGGTAGAARQAPAVPPAAAPARAKPSFPPMPSMFGAAPKQGAESAPVPPAQPVSSARPQAAPASAPRAPQAAPGAQPQSAAPAAQQAGDAGAAADAPHPVDAMQWWAALTQQFADLASNALRDTAISAQKLAGTPPGGAAAQPGQAGTAAGSDASGAGAGPARNGEPAK